MSLRLELSWSGGSIIRAKPKRAFLIDMSLLGSLRATSTKRISTRRTGAGCLQPATPAAVLERIDQLPMELHGVNEQRFVDVVRKLKQTFYVVNLHFNNHACSSEAAPLPSAAFQVLFVNKRIGVLDEAAGTSPHRPLNAPDHRRRPDCQLVPASL